MIDELNFYPDRSLILKLSQNIEYNINKFKRRVTIGKWVLIISIIYNVFFMVSYGINYFVNGSFSEIPDVYNTTFINSFCSSRID